MRRRISRMNARAESQFLVRSPVKIAPNWSEANERTTQVHKLRGFSRGGESCWLIANEWICGCYSYACTRDAQPPWGQADDPEAKWTRSPAMLFRDANDAMTNRSEKRPKMRRREEKSASQIIKSEWTLRKWLRKDIRHNSKFVEDTFDVISAIRV